MSNELAQAAAIREAFDQIEESYEFMVAYAQQGRTQEVEEGGGESQIRRFLKRFVAAMDDIAKAAEPGLGGKDGAAFTQRFNSDLATMRSVIAVLLANPNISSFMIDNTLGLMAIRAFMSDMFFIDTAVLPTR